MSLLVCHSMYSLSFGTMTIEDIINNAINSGYSHVALTDIHSSSGALDFLKCATEAGISPLIGMQFNNPDGKWLYTILSLNESGWQKINRFYSFHQMEERDWPIRPFPMDDTIIIFSPELANSISLLEDEYIGILPYQMRFWWTWKTKYPHNKLIAWNLATMASENDFSLHQVLRAVDTNQLLKQLSQNQCGRPEAYVKASVEIQKSYYAAPELWYRIQGLVSRNVWDNKILHEQKNRISFTGDRSDDRLLLHKLAWDGLQIRYPNANKQVIDRLKKELEIIEKLEFSTYFLITEDIIRYGMRQGYYHVGRGSGANSLVAYCLKITDVDPIALDLYFERFINPKRTSPPDFDIDFSWDERDNVIDYIFKRYGRNYVALLATFTTFQSRSMLRSMANVIGLPDEEINKLQKIPVEDLLKYRDIRIRKLVHWALRIKDFPQHMSIHPGGMLITEKPISRYGALNMMPKGFPVVQMDMYIAEDHGFHKYDILSQRGIGHIKEAIHWVHKNKKHKIDIHRVSEFIEDKKINTQLSLGETIGCFYIESPAMRGLLSKLKCNNYPLLVAASSIIRPGVSRSGMMNAYIKRKHNPHEIEYLHPKLKDLLHETFGIMVYQEDVLKVAHHFAGLDLSEADVLRRGMSGKSRGKNELEKIKERFWNLSKSKGYSEIIINEVWRQIESFSGYSFCKAHSASFAVESYQSLFLKCYYPLEFMVGVLNNFGGFYRSEIYFHEAKRLGATIHTPCINNSDWTCNIHNCDIYIGFAWVKGIEHQLIENILWDRKINGKYKSLENFIQRIQISREQIDLLIRSGAFSFTKSSKKQLLWEKNQYMEGRKSTPLPQLFESPQEEKINYFLNLEESEIEQYYEHLDLFGFSLFSPLQILKEQNFVKLSAADFIDHINKKISIVGYFVCVKQTRTQNGKAMGFGSWIDIKGQYFDTVHFPDVWQFHPIDGTGCYHIQGKVIEEFNWLSIQVTQLTRLSVIADPRFG